MSLNLAVIIFLALISIFLLLIEVFTVLFMMTGMTERKARFQVMSMLTNSGFTTSESEVIVSSRRRRKIAIAAMLSGNVFAVVIVTMLINLFFGVEQKSEHDLLNTLIIIIGFVILLVVLKRLPIFRDRFDNLIKSIGSRLMFNATSNPLLILDYYGDCAIVEIRLTDVPEELAGKTLQETGLRETYGLQVFVIKRPHEIRHVVGPNDTLLPGDRIVLYGSLDVVHELFRMRPTHGKHNSHE